MSDPIVWNDARVREQLDQMAGRVEDASEAMRRISEDLIASIHLNFLQEGRPPWTPLAKSTVRKRGSAHPILRGPGARMFNSITPSFDADSATAGSNVIYAAIQNFGGAIERAAHSIVDLRHRVDAKGNLVRQLGKDGKPTGRAVFAKAGHKRVRSTHATVDAYSITIPARQFMVVPDSDVDTFVETLRNFLVSGETR